jgi:exopolysaccharide production protein ExoF
MNMQKQVLWRVVTASLLCLWVVTAQAQSVYTLRPGDVLEFWVAQDEQLNRSVTVGPDGRVSLPLVGQFSVEGKSVYEVEKEVTERLSRYYTDSLDLAVMLEPHPSNLPSVFVTGEVEQPGVFPYRPGMTVLHGITLAGGHYRTPLAARDVDRSIVLKSEIDAAQTTGGELVFQIARLEAELAGSELVALPDELPFDLSESDRVEIQAREQRLLDLRLAAQTSTRNVASEVRQINARGTEALHRQRAIIDRRREFLQERFAASATLVERGHMQRSQLLEQKAELALLDGEAGDLEIQIATAEAAAMEEASLRDDLVNQRRVELMAELNNTKRQLEALNARLDDNRRALAVYERDVTSDSQEAQLSYRIMRMVDGTSSQISASPMTMLLPGDLVEVVKSSGKATQPSATQTN